MSTSSDRPRRTDAALTCDVRDELLVHLPDARTIVALNASARAVWELCSGTRTVGEIAELLAGPLGLTRESLLADVTRAVEELRAIGLVAVEEEDDRVAREPEPRAMDAGGAPDLHEPRDPCELRAVREMRYAGEA